MKIIDISTPKHPNTFTMVDDEDYHKVKHFKYSYGANNSVSRNEYVNGERKYFSLTNCRIQLLGSVYKNLGFGCLVAVLALAQELKEMTIYTKTSLVGQALLQFTQVTGGEVNHGAAVRANQVMVVL